MMTNNLKNQEALIDLSMVLISIHPSLIYKLKNLHILCISTVQLA